MHRDLIYVSANIWPSPGRHNTKVECIKAEITEVSEPETSVRTIHSNTNTCKLDFCLTVHHQLGKVIQINELDAIMIY